MSKNTYQRWLSSLCCCSFDKLCPTLCTPVDCSTTGSPVFHYLQEFAQTHVYWVGDAIQPSHLLLSLSLPSLSPSNEYSGLISFRIDWFDLAVQRTLESLLQHHSSKASLLQCSAFFMVQLSHPYMTTRKTIALTVQTFFGKVMSLLFNILSRFVVCIFWIWKMIQMNLCYKI